jgi:hypothetical protein
MEWHQTPGNPGNHVFDVLETIPLILLQSLPQARSPQFRCHQPPVIDTQNRTHVDTLLTFLADYLLRLRFACDRDHLHQQAVAPLSNQRHHLLMAHLHHVHPVHLEDTNPNAHAAHIRHKHTHMHTWLEVRQRAERQWRLESRGEMVTSMRKSPVLSPALQATPSTSTDSRYWRAGNAGVGVNSSIGVSAGNTQRE